MKTERELAELIFDKFREQKCETGQIIPLKSIEYDKFIMNLNPIEKDLFYKVLNGLQYTRYYDYEKDLGGILRLTEKGYQYIYDDEKISLMQNIPWIIPKKEETNWDRAYHKLWKAIGEEGKAIFYISGPKFYSFILDLYDNIPPSYNQYMEDRKEKAPFSTSRVDYYKDLINLLDDDTRYQLYINIQIFIEDRILDKNDQDTNINISSNTSPFLDDLVGNTLSKKTEEKVFKEISNEKSSSNNEDAPKVFISYSWDSEALKKWVLDLAIKLREKGIDAILDQWELDLGKPIPNFMENSVGKSDRVICVITPKYNEKSINLHGGVGYEYSIISAEIMDKIDTQKFIPLLKEGNNENIPKSLKGRMYIDMRDDSSFEYRLEELLRDIYKEPKNKKPPIGKKPEYVENKNKERNIEIELSVLKEDISLNSILSGRFYDIHINISNIRERGSIEKLQCFVSMDNKLRQCIHYSTQIQKINNNIIQVYFENSNIINGIVISYNPILPSVKRDIGILKVKKSFFDQHLLINFQVSTEFGSEEFSFFADEILY
jgi:SEFIR domain protein